MRISKQSFSADVQCVPGSQPNRAFRYLLYQILEGKDTLLFESHLFQEMKNCVASADEHLEQLISTHAANHRALRSVA